MPEEIENSNINETQSSDGVQEIDDGSNRDVLEGGDNYVVSAAKGSGIMTIGKLYEYVGRFVIAFLLARVLGADQFGLYSLALSAADYRKYNFLNGYGRCGPAKHCNSC